LGNDGNNDGKVFLVDESVEVVTTDCSENWGGTLSDAKVEELKEQSTEVGGLIILNREKEGSDYTIGEYTTSDGSASGYMLEPAGPSTTTAGKDKRIPSGVYDVDSYSSQDFPDNFIISNSDVSKVRKILIHIGNDGGDTSGCLLPGKTAGNSVVNNSGDEMKEVRNYVNSKNSLPVKLIINEINGN
jgi:hypothetical protein